MRLDSLKSLYLTLRHVWTEFHHLLMEVLPPSLDTVRVAWGTMYGVNQNSSFNVTTLHRRVHVHKLRFLTPNSWSYAKDMLNIWDPCHLEITAHGRKFLDIESIVRGTDSPPVLLNSLLTLSLMGPRLQFIHFEHIMGQISAPDLTSISFSATEHTLQADPSGDRFREYDLIHHLKLRSCVDLSLKDRIRMLSSFPNLRSLVLEQGDMSVVDYATALKDSQTSPILRKIDLHLGSDYFEDQYGYLHLKSQMDSIVDAFFQVVQMKERGDLCVRIYLDEERIWSSSGEAPTVSVSPSGRLVKHRAGPLQ